MAALRPTIKQSDRNSLVIIVESISSVGANSLKLTIRHFARWSWFRQLLQPPHSVPPLRLPNESDISYRG
jgi:hypothetical protein